jgi:hypothetical protein
MTRIFAILLFTSTLGFAQSFSGALVDNVCYAREERNVTLRNPDANHDRDFEIRQCSPNAKTKEYAVVDHDGQSLKLDAAGNAKAAKLVSDLHRKGRLEVNVSGRKSKETLLVTSIAASQ